jgi:CRISPR-associated protein Cas2
MTSFSALNEYRCMWVLVFFDMPVETKKQKKAAAQFRKELVKDGFTMFQFSIYMRNCPSSDNADVHIKRVKGLLPEYGHVGILKITDKQFGMMELFLSSKPIEKPEAVQQLELF